MTKKGQRPQTRENIAHHEAGHFVAAYVHAMHESIHTLTIVPAGDAAGATLGESPLGYKPSPLEIRRLVIGLFAGYAAELQFDPHRVEEARYVATDDDDRAETYLARLYRDEGKREMHRRVLRAQAGALIDEHWGAVTSLANELVGRGQVDGEEAALIVIVAEGERAKRELAALRRAARLQMPHRRAPTRSTR